MAGGDAQVSPEAFLAMGRAVLASQPFSVLIGAELHALAPGTVARLSSDVKTD